MYICMYLKIARVNENSISSGKNHTSVIMLHTDARTYLF